VWSCEPETTWRPSGVTATAVTGLVWPPRSSVSVSPVARSQTRISVLELETTWRPSGVTTTAPTERESPKPLKKRQGMRRKGVNHLIWTCGHHQGLALTVVFVCPITKSQTRRVPSSELEITWRPTGVIATPFTEPVWPRSVILVCPVARSQTRRVLSRKPETTWRPLGQVPREDSQNVQRMP
jgi:hypothetical protein